MAAEPSDFFVVAGALQLSVNSHGLVKNGTGDAGRLRFGEVDEEWQEHFLELDQLIDEAFFLEDLGVAVGRCLFKLDDLLSQIFARHWTLDHFFKKLDSVAGLLVIGSSGGGLQIFG